MSHPILICEGLSKTYDGEVPVIAVKPASITVFAGEQIAICGPSGSGKSTLMNLLGLLDVADAGSYQLKGANTWDLDEGRRAGLRARVIGFVFQSFHLVGGRSATENVEMGLLYHGVEARVRRQRSRDTLDRVGLSHRLDTDVSRLSGGERQRVAIARAIVHRPDLLLADEPTGNLDSLTSSKVLELLDDLNHDGFTQIIVTHNQAIAARTKRQFDMLDGRLLDSEGRG